MFERPRPGTGFVVVDIFDTVKISDYKVIVDISDHQGYDPYTQIDYDLLAEKADAVIIRASIGQQEDRNFQENYRELSARGVPIGLYHYYVDYINPIAQSDLFEELIARKKLLLGAWADFEMNYSKHSQTTLANYFKTFLESIETPNTVGIYTAAWFWDVQVGTKLADYFAQYPLWFAHYTNDFDNLLIPYPWKDDKAWFLHQYSADGNNRGSEFGVVSDDIDIDRMNPELLPPTPEPPPTAGITMKVLPRTLRVRSDGDSRASITGQLLQGDVITVLDIKVENGYRVWVKHSLGWSALVYNGAVYLERVY